MNFKRLWRGGSLFYLSCRNPGLSHSWCCRGSHASYKEGKENMQDLADWLLIHAWQWYASASPGPYPTARELGDEPGSLGGTRKEYAEHPTRLSTHLAPLTPLVMQGSAWPLWGSPKPWIPPVSCSSSLWDRPATQCPPFSPHPLCACSVTQSCTTLCDHCNLWVVMTKFLSGHMKLWKMRFVCFICLYRKPSPFFYLSVLTSCFLIP